MSKPTAKPNNPNFGSGPCSKRPGYNLDAIKSALLGRSHRSTEGKARIEKSIVDTKKLLGLPSDYVLGIVPASDTGAFEMAMWSMLGALPVDVLFWESFGQGWHQDITKQLKLKDVTTIDAGYGKLPDLSKANFDHDVVFAWNGTTSGVKIPDGKWIKDDRKGLTFCDATSAVFAMDLPWAKLDVTTYSWQKVLGGEAAHGVIILSPRALKRLEQYTPPWPLPKIFRMASGGKVTMGLFSGETINTPSMMCVEDYIDALNWAVSLGGIPALVERSKKSLSLIEDFVKSRDWISFLAEQPEFRSNTSVCFTVKLTEEKIKKFQKLLKDEKVAYDINSYKDAPVGLRIWCGATVESQDIQLLLPWLDWAYAECQK